MLVGYNTCLESKGLGSIDVQERNWLFKGLFSLVDVSLKIRKGGFYWKLFVFLVSGKDFQPKYLATIDLTPPNCLGKELVYDSIICLV